MIDIRFVAFKRTVISILISSLLISCAKDNNTPANTLRVDICAEIPTFDPALADDWHTYRVINDLYAGLVDFDQANRPIPGMAYKWDISADGLTYTFHLRPDLKFSNGSPIKASDFVYSWRRLVNPKIGSSYSFLLKDVLNAKEIIAGKLSADKLAVLAPDEKTFVVQLAQPTNPFLSYITTPNVFVVHPEIIEKFADKWTKPRNIVTSGPYVLKEHVLNGYILVEKNPYYYAESTVKIPQIKYYPYVDGNAALSHYKTGDLDMTCQVVPPDQYKNLTEQYPQELHTFGWERIDYLNLNMKNPKFANNPKLRQALSLAINREELTKLVLGAGQQSLYSVVTPTIENGKYADVYYSWKNLSRDKQLSQARKLYQEAGYNITKPLKLELKYQTNELNKKVALAIMSMWKEALGIELTLVGEELKVLIQDLKSANYDVGMGRWGADYNSITTYTPLFICNNGNNRSHYCNLKYDNLITEAEKTVNSDQQIQIYKQALQIVLNDFPIVPLFAPTHQRLVHPRIMGYEINDNYLDNVQSKWFYFK